MKRQPSTWHRQHQQHHFHQNMGEPYDDWGNPVAPRPQPKDESLASLLRAYFVLIFRRYRTVTITVLLAICTILYWRSGGSKEEVIPPVDWSRFAYVQYVTDNHNLCNAYMVFEALERLGSKAERVMLYPQQWDLVDESPQDRNSQLLIRAEKLWKVKLRPVALLDTDGTASPGTLNAPSSWATSVTKLRAFELGEYDRVLHLDSDITLLQHMDELFLLPRTPIAMPRAYWLETSPKPLTSLMMLIEPNPAELRNFRDILMSWKMQPGFQVGRNYDMDLLNHRFGSSAMVLPHRPYAMLTAEFRNKDHSSYLGTINGPRDRNWRYEWDPDRALEEAKLVHFSDWPLPKPWVMWPPEGVAEIQPDCDGDQSGCRERTLWKGLYNDFRKRRKDLCRILSVPAPKWENIKNATAA